MLTEKKRREMKCINLKRKRERDGVGVKERDMERKGEREMEKERYCVCREREGGRERAVGWKDIWREDERYEEEGLGCVNKEGMGEETSKEKDRRRRGRGRGKKDREREDCAI